MAEYGDIPFKYIRNREILKSSLHILMHGTSSMAMSYRKITEANLLEKKLRFIVTLMDQWVAGGGLGVTSDPSKLTWDGPQLEDSKKQDWVTVGRYGGDKNN
jgi:myosin-1